MRGLFFVLLLMAQSAFAQVLCTGQGAAGGTPADVTSKMSQVASGVNVYQLTNDNTSSNGSVMVNSDLNHYSGSAFSTPYWLFHRAGLGGAVQGLQLSDNGQRLEPTGGSGAHARWAWDSSGFTQAGGNGTGVDVGYVQVSLASPGPCTYSVITNHQLPSTTQNSLSVPTVDPWDTHTPNWHLITYAMGGTTFIYSVYVENPYPHSDYDAFPPLNPNDGCSGTIFNRMRSSPKWPRWVEYGRCNPPGRILFWVRIDTGEVHALTGAGMPGGCTSGDFSLDGLKFICSNNPTSVVATVFNTDGTFNTNWAPTVMKISNTARTCTFTSDSGSPVVCIAPGGAPLPGTASGCEALFYVSQTNTPNSGAQFVTCTDPSSTYAGYLRWGYRDSNGSDHIIFDSNKSGTSQIYEVVVPAINVPAH